MLNGIEIIEIWPPYQSALIQMAMSQLGTVSLVTPSFFRLCTRAVLIIRQPVDLFGHIRMSANRAGPLPETFIQRIDAVISDIESWQFQQQLSGERGTDPSETRVFYTDIVGGLFDALYYLGWSTRKPVGEITYEDLCQL